MSDDIRWIRSYVLEEGSGVGTVCIYQASSPEAIRAHAAAADLPVDEIIRVADTVLVRPDPGDRLRGEIEMKKRALILALAVLPVLAAVGAAVACTSTASRPLQPSTTSTRLMRPGYSVRVFDLAGIDCIAQPGQGAMGIHMLNPALLDSTIDADHPELLVYEPRNDGTLKLVRSSTSSSRTPGTAPRSRRSSARSSTRLLPATGTACPRSTRCTPGSGSRIRAGCSTPGTPGSTARLVTTPRPGP